MKDLFPHAVTPPKQNHVFFPGLGLHAGLEVRRGSQSYYWDGLRRGGEARAPYGLFQYTLEGHGVLESGRASQIVPPGRAFLVRIPSRHVYRVDPACAAWKFFWVIFDHPYVVARLLGRRDLLNRVLELPPESSPVRAAVAMVEKIWRGRDDPQSHEEALLVWMLELERWAFARRHPTAARRRLLEHVRQLVLADPAAALPTAKLADSLEMSRTNFAHHFAKTTGETPGAFIREVRLGEAARLLREGRLSIKEVAAATGFANANHFGKCFRGRFRLTPGEYRRR